MISSLTTFDMIVVNRFQQLLLGIIILVNVQCSKDPGNGGPGTGTPTGGPTYRPPFAKAGPDLLVILPDNFTTLDGSTSTDPENNISSYSWSKISGPVSFTIANPTAPQTQVTNLIEGSYKFELKVTDLGGLTSKDTIMVLVQQRVIIGAPVANAGPDQMITLPVNATVLNGSGSFDPNGTTLSYSWTKVSGPSSYTIANPNGVQTTITGLTEGVYQFLLKVTDASGYDAYDYVIVIVDTNVPGTYNFYNVPWKYDDCTILVNNIYSTIPPARPFKVYLGATDYWNGWFLIHPSFTGSSGFYYQVINGNLKIFSVGIDCAFDSGTYAVRIVMD